LIQKKIKKNNLNILRNIFLLLSYLSLSRGLIGCKIIEDELTSCQKKYFELSNSNLPPEKLTIFN
jgi:hypothetical protein